LIRSARESDILKESDVQDRIVFLDSAVISMDPVSRHSGSPETARNIAELKDRCAAGLVLVTQRSGAQPEGQGKFVGDGIAWHSSAISLP
jgi:hypothetical protein